MVFFIFDASDQGWSLLFYYTVQVYGTETVQGIEYRVLATLQGLRREQDSPP